MKLVDFMSRKAIITELKSSGKRSVISELVQVLKKTHSLEKFQVQETTDRIMERETKIGSTGLGGGVAVPHAKLPGVKSVFGAFGRSTRGISFNAIDGEPVHLVFLILSPAEGSDVHLKALQKVMTAIKRGNTCRFLKAAKTAKEIEDIFKEAEEPSRV